MQELVILVEEEVQMLLLLVNKKAQELIELSKDLGVVSAIKVMERMLLFEV